MSITKKVVNAQLVITAIVVMLYFSVEGVGLYNGQITFNEFLNDLKPVVFLVLGYWFRDARDAEAKP